MGFYLFGSHDDSYRVINVTGWFLTLVIYLLSTTPTVYFC